MSSSRIPDPGSLIAGIAFAGVGLIFLVGDVELADRARWVWPIVLVGLGAGLLAAVLRRPTGEAADGPAATATAGDTATFPPPEPSTSPPEPAAAAGLLYEPPDEPGPDPAPEGLGPRTSPAKDSLADPSPAEGGAAEPDAAEGSTTGDAAEQRERS